MDDQPEHLADGAGRAPAAGPGERVETLLALVDNSPDVIARYDRGHRLRFMNATAERAFGHPRAALIGRAVHELPLPPALREAWTAGLRRVFASGEPAEGEFELPAPGGADAGGGARTFQARLTPERDARGEVASVLVTTRDVTDQRRAEGEARTAAALLHALFEQLSVGIAVARIDDGRFVRVNAAAAAIYGYPVEAMLGIAVTDLAFPEDRAAARERTARVATGEVASYTQEGRYRRGDGRAVWARVSVCALRGADGRPTRYVGVSQDVTERAEAERALRESEERFRALVEHASDLIAILDPDGTNRYASPSHEAVLGVSPAELRGRAVVELVHTDDVAAARRAFARAVGAPGPVGPEPLRFRHRDGSWRTLLVTLADLRATPGVGGIVVNSRDVTKQRALEERLRQSQQLEALGQLAGGVAHDFNNVLAAIVGYGQMVVDALPAGDPRRENAEQVVGAAHRGTDLTRQLLAFSRRGAVETEVVDLAAVTRGTARMLRPLLPASIALVAPPDDAPPVPVRAARAQVEQIVLNLAVNARDAMPDGGTLTIAARAGGGPNDGAPGAAPAARLTVRDTGVGIPPEVRARLFEPFCTTKPIGRGTGLGLATVYGLVDQFGGTVEVESEVGRGTTFTVTLPLAAEAELSQAPAAPVPRDRSRPAGPAPSAPAAPAPAVAARAPSSRRCRR